jgi:hypothetical protein
MIRLGGLASPGASPQIIWACSLAQEDALAARTKGIGQRCRLPLVQRHEAHRKQLLRRHLSVVRVALKQHEALKRQGRAERYHQATAGLELADQRRRGLARRGSDNDAIKRCRFLPDLIAVTRPRCDIVIAQPL